MTVNISTSVYIEVARNQTHVLWQRGDGKQACLPTGAHTTNITEYSWADAGVWELGCEGGYRLGKLQTPDFVAERPACSAVADDEREACLCHPESNPLCPEHGERCRNIDCDRLIGHGDVWSHRAVAGGQARRFCSCDCLNGTLNSEMKASPYQGNDLDMERQYEEWTRSRHESEAARKPLLAALAAESPRVTEKPFPSVGRDSRVYRCNR